MSAEVVIMRVTRADGLVTRAEAALLCDVSPEAISNWVSRGYWSDALDSQAYLPVAKREGRKPLFDTIELAKAEYATRKRARRPGYVAA